jgi:biofilm PGA synthesis N-glycosyltransferase PgaC
VTLLFWFSLALVLTAYAGYPACLYLQARWRPRPVRRGPVHPTVTVILAVRNEEMRLPDKLQNLSLLEYPAEHLEIIAISDGSSDATNDILAKWQRPGRHAIFLPHHQGKSAALDHGIVRARGEIICFVDVAQTIESDGLQRLVEPFADPTVGCVSGEWVSPAKTTASSGGVGLYWRLETSIRKWESLTGSTVGATGAFYAIRKEAISRLPNDTVLDDVYLPLQIARRGLRVVLESGARALETRTFSPTDEFRRKVRTLTGNYQLLRLAPWVITRANPLRARFIFHKVLRLLVPFALVALLISSLLIRSGVYKLALLLQVAFYGLALCSSLRVQNRVLSRLSSVSLAFLILNTAAAMAFLYFVSGKKPAWAR